MVQAKHGIEAFLCDVPVGENIKMVVVEALHKCKMAIVLGTSTYGKKTKSSFSTYEEMEYIIDKQKPYFLMKMCHDYLEPSADFNFTKNINYYEFIPKDLKNPVLPSDLCDKIVAKLRSL